MRDQPSGDPNGARYEEWIYGHVPQTVKFVRFVGDRVAMVEIAEMGKPIQIHDKDELAGYQDPSLIHEVALGDRKPGDNENGKAAPPSLHRPDDADDPDAPLNTKNKVQFPDDPKTADSKPDATRTTNPKPAASSPDNSQPTTTRAKPSLGPTPAADASQLMSQLH